MTIEQEVLLKEGTTKKFFAKKKAHITLCSNRQLKILL
jgi:hypothetical protein